MITNLRYADDIILSATLEAELQELELVDRLDRVNRKYSLLINVDKTRVMASDIKKSLKSVSKSLVLNA